MAFFNISLSKSSNNLLVRQPSHLELFISESYEQLVQFHSLCVDTVDGENPPMVYIYIYTFIDRYSTVSTGVFIIPTRYFGCIGVILSLGDGFFEKNP